MALNNLTNNISESEYTFNEKALQLANNFFDVNDVSMLKTGMFGYMTSMFSHMMRDSTYHRNMLYNEFFLTKASLNSTLYNWSKMLNHPLELASPAKINVMLRMDINDLLSISEDSIEDPNIKKVIIDRSTPFDLGGKTFMLPYQLEMNIYRNKEGRYSVNAIYNLNESNFKPDSIKTPILKVLSEAQNNKYFININFEIFQIQRYDYIFSVMSNDLLDASIIEQTYSGYLVGFNALYNESNVFDKAYLKMETIFNEFKKPSKERYCYYTLIGSDTIRLYWDNKPKAFRPVYNSKVKMEIFTTEGDKGNFNYTGRIQIRESRFENVPHVIIPLEQKTRGGSNLNNFTENKIALMELLSTRNNYTTTYDLQNFFKKVRKELGYTRNEFEVVKSKDDILRRQFSTYMLLRDKDGHIVPTNTIDLEVDLIDLERMNYSLKPGTLILYDRQQAKYRLLDENELPEVYLADSDSYLYCNPFLVNFNFYEYLKANSFLTHYDKNVELFYSYYNTNSITEVLMNNYNLARNPIVDLNHFTLKVNLLASVNILENVKVRTFIYKENTPIGYADLSRINNSSEFNLKVLTNDEFSPTGKYIITNTFKDINDNTLIRDIELDGSYRLKFAILYNNGISENNSLNGDLPYHNMTDLKSYSLICELDSNEPIHFADDLTDIIYNQITTLSNDGKLILRKLPIIGALYYLNDYKNSEIMTKMYEGFNIVRTISRRLENNTSIDIKFYNTYGISRYFTIDTIDLRVKFSIALNTAPTKILTDRIEEDIVTFIEGRNNLTDKRFSISNLISYLEKEYPQIRFIKIFTINNAGIQSIENTVINTGNLEELPYDYVPEYLTVRKALPRDTSSDDFSYDINITYK